MEKFIEYKRFLDIEGAYELGALLDEKGILYQIDEGDVRFSLNSNPFDNETVFKIMESDFEKVDSLLNETAKQEAIESSDEYYLYSFADKDIVDIIANQDGWSRADVHIAMQIAKQRNLDLSAESIKKAKPNEPESTHKTIPIKSFASWFLWIGIFSLLNTVFAILDIQFRLPDLVIIPIVVDFLFVSFTPTISLVLSVSLIFPLLFIVIWYFAKQKRKFFYIIGFILFSIDTILTLKFGNWMNIIFHVFVNLILLAGFNKKYVD